MPRRRALAPLELSPAGQAELESLARSRALPASLVQRAELVLLSAQGWENQTVADMLGLTRQTVGLWRERFRRDGLVGLYDERRPGRPRAIREERIMRLLRTTLRRQPADGSTHWSVRTAADATGLSKSTVQRVWAAVRRGSFCSVRALCDQIEHFTTSYTNQAQPFVWAATADSILQKIERLCQRISGTQY